MDKWAEKLAQWFGSVAFIAFHVVWFSAWLISNAFLQFDKEYSILTIVVSLEAIFLSLFILRAENVQAERQEKKTKQDIKSTESSLKVAKRIDRKLGAGKSKKLKRKS